MTSTSDSLNVLDITTLNPQKINVGHVHHVHGGSGSFLSQLPNGLLEYPAEELEDGVCFVH
jgi:hypothetical protein